MGLAQFLIVYDNPKGERVAYTTAYDPVQVREGIVARVNRHGRQANVRSVPA